ncbi:MAG: hypothetical protein NT066_00015, partial [Candidatus Omnitrophica bacterium]|nr:hypothetical protein [Candidatus Omnitrophota bacterium]
MKTNFSPSTSCFDFAQHPSKHPEPVEGLRTNGERPSTSLGTSPELAEGRSRTIRLGGFVFLVFLVLSLPRLLSAESTLLPVDDVAPEISMDFQDANLKDILKVFSIQSGLNFIASEALQDRKITLYLDRVPLKGAMDKLFNANNLSYELDREANIFIVKDWGKLETETETRVFYLKYASVSSSALEKEKADSLTSSTGSTSAGSGSSGTSKSSSSTSGSSSSSTSEEESGITKAVNKLLSKDGSVIEDSRTNSLIVTDTPGRMRVIAQVIASLDVSVPQVMLEVEMLDVSKNSVDKLGVNWPTTLASLDVSGVRTTSFPFSGNKADDASWFVADEVKSPSGNWKFKNFYSSHFLPSVLTVIGANLTLDFLRTQSDTKILARPRIMTL